MRSHTALHLLSTAAALLVACGGAEPTATMELGFYRDGTYQELAPGGTCWVADAPQGGYWVMPSVRTTGLDSEATVGCELEDHDLGPLGAIETFRIFDQTASHHELEQFLLPLEAVDQPTFAELDGHTGVLRCDAIDGQGGEASAELDVVIATEVVR